MATSTRRAGAAAVLLSLLAACGGSTAPTGEGPVNGITITAQPQSRTVIEGEPATFLVEATAASAALTYQWQVSVGGDWQDLPGATGASHVTPPAQAADDGAAFRCRITGPAGSVDSVSASLRVNWLHLLGQPAAQVVVAGQAATFTVTAAGSPAGLAYQWQRDDGSGWADLPGEIAPTYAFSPALTDTGARFRCRVSNGALTVESQAASLDAGLGLTVTVAGLPAGLDASVTVTGPGGFRRLVRASQVLPVPGPGTYQVLAATVEDPSLPPLGGALAPTAHLARHPWRPAQTVEVPPGGSAAAEVLYPLPAFTVNLPDAANPGQSVPMDFVLIPAGRFTMGSSHADDAGLSYAGYPLPLHEVTFATAFYLASRPCTQEQWRAITNTNPSYYTSARDPRMAHPHELQRPVETVSWDDLRAPDTGFLALLNGALPGLSFRLPSEAEFEYAQRGGTTSRYFFGADGDMGLPFGWHNQASFSWGTSNHWGPQPTAHRLPNPWGLYDLVGSVLQWCEDDQHDYTVSPDEGSAWVDVPVRASRRITRGARSWSYQAFASGVRALAPTPDVRSPSFGFRLAVGVPVTVNPGGHSLAVTMPGLPAPVTDPNNGEVTSTAVGAVTVTGPGGYRRLLTGATTLSGLAAGTYTITAEPVADVSQPGAGRVNGGVLGPQFLTYHPVVAASTVTLGPATGTAQVAVVHHSPRYLASPASPLPFVLIPPGSFTMGSPDTEPGRSAIEGPARSVTIAEPFYLMSTEVTQHQWASLMAGANPAHHTASVWNPVEQVSWNDLEAFVAAANAATRAARPPGMALRLPTEAEWEYAARAGGGTPFLWEPYSADAYAWYVGNSGGAPHVVNGKAPNGWGLFDMSGNVWEWVADWYGDYDAAAEAAVDPAGPPIGPGRVLRGGGFGYDLPVLRSASRAFAPPDSRFSAVGFRLALVGGAPLITAGPVRQTVVEGDDVTFSVEAKGRGPLHYQWRWNLSAVGGDSPTLTLSAVDRSWAGYLTVTVSNDLDEVTSAPAELIVKDPPVLVSPSVISTPAPQTVTVGDPVTFTVVADGTRPLHYQWQKDGADVGGDDATFSIAAATFADAGQYRVTITNVVGSWTTGAVPLVVGPAVVITTQPAGQLVALGDDFTLTVAATGPAPLHYQWMRDGVGVGSDAPSLTITGAQVDDSGSYTVTVSNARGSATSAAAVVTVSATVVAPVITTQPASQSASVGFGAAFTVAATGTKPLHYQWRRGTTPVGADSSQLAIASVQAADAGDYTVTVSNAAGSVTSEVAALTVVSTPTFTLPGGVALALAPIPAGTFTMGSSAAEHGTTYTMEGPQHAVTLGAFYMGPYEVTQAQWLAVMGGTPAYFRPGGTSPNGEIGPSTVTTDDPTRPVEQVSYFDLTTPTTGFLDRLNALTAATRPAGLVFRLPTEAEWEYAARAGTTTAYSWGDDGYANGSQSLYVDYAWWPGNGGGVTHGTGELKLPNAFGLHNMSGNVWEWCQDWYGAAYYASSPGIDPAGPATGDAGERVARGGDGILLGQYVARSAMRMKFSPDTAFRIVGFRLVLGAPRTP